MERRGHTRLLWCRVRRAPSRSPWTVQRQGDLLRLTWKDYDGTYIRMSKGRSSKGRRRATIPVGPPLKAALDAALKEKRSAVTILVNSFGRPWMEDGFRTSWDKAFRKTSLKDLHFHDLRGTAVTRLALSNCSVPEIAAITGHSMKTVQQILDAHYLGGRLELAELSKVYGQGQKRVWDVDRFQVKASSVAKASA